MLDRIDLPQLPPKVDTFGQAARFLADSLAQAAGISVAPKPVDPSKVNIEIEDWRDWVRLIAGFKHMATWHEEAWSWAWTIQRGVYQPPFVAIAARGSGKCLEENTPILLGDGTTAPIRDLETGDRVFCYDEKTGRVTTSIVMNKWGPDTKSCIKIITRTQEIVLSREHKVLTFNGWKQAGDLSLNDRVASPRHAMVPEFMIEEKHSDAEVKLLAYLIAEGTCDNRSVGFTNADQCIVDDFIKCANDLGLTVAKIGGTAKYQYHLQDPVGVFYIEQSRGNTKRHGKVSYNSQRRSLSLRFLEKNGIRGKLATEKRVPQWVFRAPERQRWLFLAAMFDTDGYITKGKGELGIALANPGLINDLRSLLRSLGVVTKTYSKKNKCAGAWSLTVDQDCLQLCLKNLPLILKGDRLALTCSTERYSLTDTYPTEVNNMLPIGMTKHAFSMLTGIRIGNLYKLTRDKLRRMINQLPLRQWEFLEQADVFWDEIMSITDVGEQTTYDIEVYKHHNMVSAGLITHNSSTAEALICALGARGTRKHVLYVRATQVQANASIANIASILENGPISEYYPLMGDRLISAFGQSRGWNRTMLRTASGFTVVGFGLDSSLRGFKVDDYRPDLICHQIGTKIYDPDIGDWLKVEDHPGVITIKRGPGLSVKVAGVPDAEIVTPEHRYWARHMPNKQLYTRPDDYDPVPKWTEAKDLRPRCHFVGLPIDQEVVPVQAIPVVTLKSGEYPSFVLEKHEQNSVPDEFNDPDWWWLIGLWWRRGGFDGNHLYVHFKVYDDTTAAQRILSLLTKYGIQAERIQDRRFYKGVRRNYYHIFFVHDTLYRWLRTWTNVKNDYRVPPRWIEKIDHAYQKQLVLGYINAENHQDKQKAIRITKEALEDFYVLRRILARLGIPAMICENKVKAVMGGAWKPYLLYARDNVRNVLGLDIEPSRAYFKDAFIDAGCLWSRINDVKEIGLATFVPIQTKSHTYLTNIGKNHNCLDDIDSKHDSPGIIEKKIETITTSILPAGSSDMTALAIQNLITDNGIFSKFADGTADFLADRIMVGPIPAIENLEYRVLNNVPRITGGTPTWEGQPLAVCEDQMKKWGVKAFLAEAQHLTSVMEGGTFDGVIYTRMSEADLPDLARIVCWIDPAVSATSRSDCQAIQIDAIERIKNPKIRPRIFRLYSWEGIAKPSDMIRRALREGTARNVEKIGIETNMGGILWEDEYLTIAGDMLDAGEIEYIPTFDSEKAGAHTGGKEDRAGRMLTDYTRNYIVHVEGTHDTLENALGRFPMVAPDDLVDAAYWAWYDLRSKDKWRGKPRFAKINREKLFGGRTGASRGSSRASHLRRLGLR